MGRPRTSSILPCLVNDSFFLVAVWTKHASTFRYIGQMWRYLQVHREKIIQRPCAIVGDFNSNVFWDKKHRCWNHSDVVRELNAIEISSLYHGCSNEPQGTESAPTFYLHRDLKKPYHIDYAFVSESIKSNRPNFYVGSAEDWLKHSDHMPIVFSLSLSESVSNEQRIKSLPQRRKSAS